MPRPDVSEERRSQILDAAAAVFARLGVRDARMDDIVAQAELSKGALYWYFDSKDALVAAFIERLFTRALESFHLYLGTDVPFGDRMGAIAAYIAADIQSLSKLRGVVLEYYALAARDANVRRRVREHLEQCIDLLETTIRRAIERRECRAVDARKTAIWIEAIYEGLTLLWITDASNVAIDEMLEHSTRMILESLSTGAAHAS
jgi:AcrR family transcriptional regulator